MTRFVARTGVEARFAERDLGIVTNLDIGPFDDPDQPDMQYYVFSHRAQQDVVRFECRSSLAEHVGRLGVLTLKRDGARYQVEALCSDQQALGDGRYALRFEAQHPPDVRASARERHGIDDLGAALLIDALTDD